MIKHSYSGCLTCHTDPSGAGLLTQYGRAQSNILLSSKYREDSAEQEPPKAGGFLFGAVTPPSELLLQGWVRNGYIWNEVDGKLVDHRVLQTRADVGAHVALGAFRAQAIVGYNDRESATFAQQAWLTRSSSAGNVVSREHWVGAELGDGELLLRAGRLNLPFGLRTLEHTAWTRSETRTDINQDQQHGVALAYNTELIRAEAMLIAGNFQVSPDAFRERGYSGYLELAVASHYAAGVSSMVTHAASDLLTHLPTTRQAHGVFFRGAVIQQLVLLAEFDSLVNYDTRAHSTAGYVGSVQVEFEPWQGVHAVALEEVLKRGGDGERFRQGTWLGLAWFPFTHFDIRVDGIRRTAANSPTETTVLAQVHVYF